MDFSAAAPEVRPVTPSPDWVAEPVSGSVPTTRPNPDPPTARGPQTNFGRRLFQAMLVFFCLFLLIRTVALEPFGVPTGSMAAALTGNHRSIDCPRCGYHVRVGEPGPDARPVKFDVCSCPNCGQALDLTESTEIPGDRLLVDKSVYHARSPRRWEIAVFHCPADLTKPYVKRVVGLPGEVIQISGGDVYANGELVRKTLAQFRELRLPIFDLNFAPPEGWSQRWLREASKPPALARPVSDAILRDQSLILDATVEPIGLTYRHWNLDTRKEEAIHDSLGYNGGPGDRFASARGDTRTGAVHDFAVQFDLEIVNGTGTLSLRLQDAADAVRAELPIGGSDPLHVVHEAGPRMMVATNPRFQSGKTYHVEFAFVDRRASLAINGREVVSPLDLPYDPAGRPRRGSMARPVQLGVSGVSVVVRNFRLERDIHYLSVTRADKSWTLGPTEYFVLGDNSSNSHDSRYWIVNEQSAPGVPESDFIGKPFLIHQPLGLGRVTINGRDHRFRTLDWARVRWLR